MKSGTILSFWFWILIVADIHAGETPLKWRQEGLDAHNKYRLRFEAEPLKMDMPWLCNMSQRWADLRAAGKVKGHNPNLNGRRQTIGENIVAYSKGETGGVSVSYYYELEIGCFDPDDPKSNINHLRVGHFAQVVSSFTTSMCQSYALAAPGSSSFSVVVANYYPSGDCGRDWCQVKFKKFPNGTRLETGYRKGPNPGCGHTRDGMTGISNKYRTLTSVVIILFGLTLNKFF